MGVCLFVVMMGMRERRWWDFNTPWRGKGRGSLGPSDSDRVLEGKYMFLEVNDIQLIGFLRPLATSEEQDRTGLSGSGKSSNYKSSLCVFEHCYHASYIVNLKMLHVTC